MPSDDPLNYYNGYSVSPRDRFLCFEDADDFMSTGFFSKTDNKSMMSSDTDATKKEIKDEHDQSYFDRLSKFKFPSSSKIPNTVTYYEVEDQSPTNLSHISAACPTLDGKSSSFNSTESTTSAASQASPTTPKTKYHTLTKQSPSQLSYSPTRSPRSPRSPSHRRSTPHSESSYDSIFSEISKAGQNYNSRMSSAYSDSIEQQQQQHFKQQYQQQLQLQQQQQYLNKGGELQPGLEVFETRKIQFACPPKKNKPQQQQPIIIDLDVAAKPLRPRSSPTNCSYTFSVPKHLRRNSLEPMGHDVIKESEVEDVEDDDHADENDDLKTGSPSPNDSVDLVDFLRESMSERAMSVSEDYNPQQYIRLDNRLWIQSTATDIQ